ncbi:MAG TPA: linear amide C-N hydrolase [Chitinophagaceae bacterium]|nr:linear amide C-N hydrolase [Chitinophagaceae bacterium]
MKISAFACLICCLFVQVATACSTFFIHHNGQMVFGRNYDWVAGTGLLCSNQRGLSKTSYKMEDGRTISWTSKYGSLSFNQYGKEFPTGGMNEKGLVVELMWLDETKYPKQDERPAISVLQWIQYQLDNAASVEEVIASDKLLRISNTGAPLHYLVADAGGHAATIEFLEGRMVVHTGNKLSMPVLTNSVYAESVGYATEALARNETGNSSSLGRFVTACDMVRRYQSGKAGAQLVDHSFKILDAVKQGDHTKWSIVYDISNRKVYFKTLDAPQVKSVAFSALAFSCRDAAVAFDINEQARGDISKLFKPLTMEQNKKTLKETASLSKNEVDISVQTQDAMARYASLIGCR